MVVVFSSSSNNSPQVMREVERAVQKDVLVVPFRIDAVTPSRDMEYFLSSTHWLDARTGSLEISVEELVRTTAAILGRGAQGDRPPAEQAPGPAPRPRAAGRRRALFLMPALLLLIGLVAFFSLRKGEHVVPVGPAAIRVLPVSDNTEGRVAGYLALKLERKLSECAS